MKRILIVAAICISALGICSQTPPSKFQVQSIKDRMAAMQIKMDKMIANHAAVMARMKQIEDALDAWTKKIHDARKPLEGKKTP